MRAYARTHLQRLKVNSSGARIRKWTSTGSPRIHLVCLSCSLARSLEALLPVLPLFAEALFPSSFSSSLSLYTALFIRLSSCFSLSPFLCERASVSLPLLVFSRHSSRHFSLVIRRKGPRAACTYARARRVN